MTGSRAGKYKVVRFSDDGEKLTTEAVDEEPPLQSGESSEDPNQDLWVLNAPHQLCHFPHRPDCEICCRAKMRTQQVARKRPAAPRGLGGQLCAPCQELSTDPIIMSKGQDDRRMSSDGHLYVHTIRDKYSGLCLAVPQHSKTVDCNVANFRKFCGPRNSNEILVKSDAAPELLEAVDELGCLLYTSPSPRDRG